MARRSLLVLLVGPLYLFSSANPVSETNLVLRTHAEYRLTRVLRVSPDFSSLY